MRVAGFYSSIESDKRGLDLLRRHKNVICDFSRLYSKPRNKFPTTLLFKKCTSSNIFSVRLVYPVRCTVHFSITVVLNLIKTALGDIDV